QTSCSELPATPCRLLTAPRSGLCTVAQWEPAQCATRVEKALAPTAHRFAGPSAVTPLRTLSGSVGPGTSTHPPPARCSIRAWPSGERPTVQTFSSPTAATAFSTVCGLLTPSTQALPFQWPVNATCVRCWVPTAQTSSAELPAAPFSVGQKSRATRLWDC